MIFFNIKEQNSKGAKAKKESFEFLCGLCVFAPLR
jgi:hypothetical protein